MASIRLQPPEPFDFKKPDEWLRWKRRFQQFRSVSAETNTLQETQFVTSARKDAITAFSVTANLSLV